MVPSCCKSCSIPNGKLLPNLSSSRLFLSAFHFHQPRNFQARTWVWRKFAEENRVNFQRGDWTGVKWSSQLRKTNFLTLPDLAFGFVHKRSENEIRLLRYFVFFCRQSVSVSASRNISHQMKIATANNRGRQGSWRGKPSFLHNYSIFYSLVPNSRMR